MGLAIFDLDETLIATDSDLAWGEYLVSEGLVDADEHREKSAYFYEQYQRGELDVREDLAYVCSVLARFSMPQLHELRAGFVRECIEPSILPKGKALIAEHRGKGDFPLVITSTIEFVVEPIVQLLGIDTLIATIPEIADDRYTGNILGIPSFGEGKVQRLNEWLAGGAHTLDGSYFYTDSHNDLPLLNLVEHPIAVDPDLKLQQAAEKNGWQIISLRD
ncbi:MAG: HAD family hydrolase [Pseudomonadales bacterium]